MLMVFAQRMEMILRGSVGPHTVLWGLKQSKDKLGAFTTPNAT